MSEEIIDGCRIEHNGDVNKGLRYLRDHWNDRYVLDVFEDARTSENRRGSFKVPDTNGHYVLEFIEEHNFSLYWREDY